MESEEYIPFCEKKYPEDPKSYEINTETLKAVKLSSQEVKLLRKAGREGVINKEEAEKALKSKRKGRRTEIKRAYAEKTISIFEKITKE